MPRWQLSGKTVYHIHIPKTAGSILKYSAIQIGSRVDHFRDKQKGIPPQHEHFELLKKTFNLNKSNCFTVIREPWLRTLSDYVYWNKRKSFEELNNWLKDILTLAIDDPHLKCNHFLPQYKFVSDEVNLFTHNNLNKLEEWLKINFSNKFKILEHQSEGKVSGHYEKPKKEDILDKETIELWKNLYTKDEKLWLINNK